LLNYSRDARPPDDIEARIMAGCIAVIWLPPSV